MVKIRLTRLGKHKKPFYRIVATDSRTKRDGAYIALLGTFEPFKGSININEELTIKYLLNGARPTDTILNMLKKQGIWSKYLASKQANKKVKTESKKKPKRKSKTKKVKTTKKEVKKE